MADPVGSWPQVRTAWGLAVLGAAAICGGSFFAIVAPGDGQTGMLTFPLWALGALLGVLAVVAALAAGADRVDWTVIGLCALIALGSVFWSFLASVRYQRDWERRHSASLSTLPPSAPVAQRNRATAF